jgi:hypothetical protein
MHMPLESYLMEIIPRSISRSISRNLKRRKEFTPGKNSFECIQCGKCLTNAEILMRHSKRKTF